MLLKTTCIDKLNESINPVQLLEKQDNLAEIAPSASTSVNSAVNKKTPCEINHTEF